MSSPFPEREELPAVSPAGWLGVCLAVLAVVALILTAPGKPPASAVTKSSPTGALTQPLVPDRDGVVRTASPALSGVAAAYTLAAILKRSPADPVGFELALKSPPDFQKAGRLLGLRAETVEVTPAALRDAARPTILLLREEPDVVATVESLEGRRRDLTRFVVLAEVRGGQAVIRDPLIGRVAVPVPDLVERVEGKGIVWLPGS